MTTTTIRMHRPAAWHRHDARTAPSAAASTRTEPRIGPGRRLIERLTRRWTVDLYDMDLQLEAGELERDLGRGRR